MTSTLTLTLNPTTKTVRLTDTTTYPFTVTDFQTKGLGTITFQGDAIVQKTTVGNPLINLGTGATYYEFPAELDSSGEAANGVYAIEDYRVSIVATATDIASDQTMFFSSAGTVATALAAGDTIVVPSGTNQGTFTIIEGANYSGILVVSVEEDTVTELGISIACTFYLSTLASQSWTYSGCTLLEACVDLSSDCDYGDYGTWTVTNETEFTTQTLVSLSAVINYPSWTGEDAITVTSLPYSNNRLATGTYSVVLSEVIRQAQASDGLIIQYAASVTQEFTVRCAGSLCGLMPCYEKLRAAHSGALASSKMSQYQQAFDNATAYITEYKEYSSCGETENAAIALAALQLILDTFSSASGCGCGCAEDNEFRWVQNTSPETVTAITELQDQVEILNLNRVMFYSPGFYAGENIVYDPQPGFIFPFTELTSITIPKEQFDADPNGYATKFVEIEIVAFVSGAAAVAQIVNTANDAVLWQGQDAEGDTVTIRHRITLSTFKLDGLVIPYVKSEAFQIDQDALTAMNVNYRDEYNSDAWDLSEDLVIDLTPFTNNEDKIAYSYVKITGIDLS